MLAALIAAAVAQTPPPFDPRSSALDCEAGTISLKRNRLSTEVLQWQTDGASGRDACETAQGADDRCSFAVPRGLPADPPALGQRLVFPAAADAGLEAVAPPWGCVFGPALIPGDVGTNP